MSISEGALVEPVAVSVHAMRRGKLVSPEFVVVLGSSTIGLTAIAVAIAMGSGPVLATARHEHQAKLAKQVGADYVLTAEEILDSRFK